jgi:hypothetical protein
MRNKEKIEKIIYNIINITIGINIIVIMIIPMLFHITTLNKLFQWLDKHFPIYE